MKLGALVIALLVAGCSEDSGVVPDARPRADAAPVCPVPSLPLRAGMHDVFLSFEGVTLSSGACDDARTNCSSLVAQVSAMVPVFLAGNTGRQARITAIAGMVEEAVAPFSVDVVTTRPAAGDYRMVSIGGTSDVITGMAGQTMAVNSVCDAANRNGIGLVFEQDDQFTDRAYADAIASAFGSLAGLVPTSRGGDCMCAQSTCAHVQPCSWGTSSATLPGNSCARTSQNEQVLLMEAVGCR
jgi:hypothetical protein